MGNAEYMGTEKVRHCRPGGALDDVLALAGVSEMACCCGDSRPGSELSYDGRDNPLGEETSQNDQADIRPSITDQNISVLKADIELLNESVMKLKDQSSADSLGKEIMTLREAVNDMENQNFGSLKGKVSTLRNTRFAFVETKLEAAQLNQHVEELNEELTKLKGMSANCNKCQQLNNQLTLLKDKECDDCQVLREEHETELKKAEEAHAEQQAAALSAAEIGYEARLMKKVQETIAEQRMLSAGVDKEAQRSKAELDLFINENATLREDAVVTQAELKSLRAECAAKRIEIDQLMASLALCNCSDLKLENARLKAALLKMEQEMEQLQRTAEGFAEDDEFCLDEFEPPDIRLHNALADCGATVDYDAEYLFEHLDDRDMFTSDRKVSAEEIWDAHQGTDLWDDHSRGIIHSALTHEVLIEIVNEFSHGNPDGMSYVEWCEFLLSDGKLGAKALFCDMSLLDYYSEDIRQDEFEYKNVGVNAETILILTHRHVISQL